MFVKLNFSANKSWQSVKQILNAIINDTDITNVATLTTKAASWAAGITSGLDYSTSEIIRTVAPTTVKSHFADETGAPAGVWTLEFQVYDAPSRKYYVSFPFSNSSNDHNVEVGNTILSGSMTTGQASMAVDLNVASNTSGTPVRLSGTAPAQRLTSATDIYQSSVANTANIRTFWMYLTNDCLIIASTHANSSNLGFNATYSSAPAYTGPFIFSQYTRYDYHNTDANGVIPLLFSNLSRTVVGAQGFGGGPGADWDRIENVNGTDRTDTAFRVFNFIDAHTQVGSSWPLTSFPSVNWGSGTRTNETSALTTKSTLSTNSLGTGQIGRLIHTTANVRWPSLDLRTLGYAMLPLRWNNSYRGNLGGNASQRGGFYIFNGDYFPGDTFVHGGKTYIVLPTYRGYTERVGIAVPKE